jgi:hypothetical protein
MADSVKERDSSLFRPSKSEINLYERHVEDMLLESGSLDIKSDEKRLLYPFHSPFYSSFLSCLSLSLRPVQIWILTHIIPVGFYL